MKGVLKIAAVGFLVAGALATAPQSHAVAANANPHTPNAEGSCAICHQDGDKGGALRRDLIGTCGACHAGNLQNHPVYRHPMNVVVKFNTPSPMPLSETKRLVCTTCHDPHVSTGYGSLLRVDYQKLCVQCHVGY
jgi:predicted CXXCH cytochrome family protein